MKSAAKQNTLAIVLLYAIFYVLMYIGFIGKYYQSILLNIGINIILAVSLNLTTGFMGQLALGHAGFMAVGAYVAGIFSKSVSTLPASINIFAAVILGGVVAAVVGFAVGVPALRLRGDYLAIITLGFGEIIRVIIENLSITGGGQGLTKIPRITSFNAVFITVTLTMAFLYSFISSRHGRAVIAIREDEIAAEACGVKVTYYRTLTFTIAAFFAGVAGALYSHKVGVLGAKDFGFARSIDIVVMVVLGGMGSFTGSIVAAIILTILPELLQGFAEYRMVIYSIVLILMMVFKPGGLMNGYEFSLNQPIDALKKRFGKPQVSKEEAPK